MRRINAVIDDLAARLRGVSIGMLVGQLIAVAYLYYIGQQLLALGLLWSIANLLTRSPVTASNVKHAVDVVTESGLNLPKPGNPRK
jgi:hypothetical protein